MTDSDGTSGFNSNNVTGTKLDTVVVWHGTTLPTAGTNKVPQYGLFLKTDTGILYENTGSLATPTWTARISGTSNGNTAVMTHTSTIGDYTIPTAVLGSSEGEVPADIDDNFSSDNFTDMDSAIIGVSGGVMVFDMTRDGTNNNSSRDVTSISDSGFLFRVKVVLSDTTVGSGYSEGFIGLASMNHTGSIRSSTCDSIGLFMYNYSVGGKAFVAAASNGAAINSPTTQSAFATTFQNGTYYLQIKRTSLTSVTIGLYSDSTYTTLTEEETLTISSSYTGLRYILFASDDFAAVATCKIVGTSDDLKLWKTVTSADALDDNIKDDSTSSRWISDSETNPNIYADMGSSLNLCAVALYWDSVVTTETEIKIQTSTDAVSWADVRKITVSNLTGSAWNYIRFNPKVARYLRVYGTGTSKILSIYEMKVYKQTDGQVAVGHGHREISTTDTALALDGT